MVWCWVHFLGLLLGQSFRKCSKPQKWVSTTPKDAAGLRDLGKHGSGRTSTQMKGQLRLFYFYREQKTHNVSVFVPGLCEARVAKTILL